MGKRNTSNATMCPYCQSDTKEGKRKGKKVIECTNCDSWVRIHEKGPKKGRPMGSLANKETRKMRYFTHKRIDKLWSTSSERTKVYNWIKNRMKTTDFHIAQMQKPQLLRLNEILEWVEREGIEVL